MDQAISDPRKIEVAVSTMLTDRRSATMTSYESSGFLHHMLIALGRALRDGILRKSGHA
jgi:hypothetical protein